MIDLIAVYTFSNLSESAVALVIAKLQPASLPSSAVVDSINFAYARTKERCQAKHKMPGLKAGDEVMLQLYRYEDPSARESSEGQGSFNTIEEGCCETFTARSFERTRNPHDQGAEDRQRFTE